MALAHRRLDTRPFGDRLADIALDGGYDEVNTRLYEAGFGDGLPLVPPTEERIGAMLAGGGGPAYAQLPMLAPGRFPPTLRAPPPRAPRSSTRTAGTGAGSNASSSRAPA